MSEGNWTKWQEFVRSVLEFAESFERIASYGMLDADDTEKLVDALTAASVGAVYAGDEQSAARLVLVSDDLGLSSFARSLRSWLSEHPGDPSRVASLGHDYE